MSSTYKDLANSEIQKEEIYNVKNYESMEKFWSEFGPISSVVLVIATMSSCGTILCCMRRYHSHLERYETDPLNPANGVSI